MTASKVTGGSVAYKGREAAGGVLRCSSKSEKKMPFERAQDFSSLVFYSRAANFFIMMRLADATYQQSLCEHGDGSEPLTSAPRPEFMIQSFVLPIGACRGLGISPLRIKHFAGYFQDDISKFRQHMPGKCFLPFSKFGFSFINIRFVYKDSCLWPAEQKLYGGYLRNSNFSSKQSVPIAIGLSKSLCLISALLQ